MVKMSRKRIGQSKQPKKRVLMALSGGIDSAVSAWKLIQEGYEVEAAFMKNWSSTTGLKYDECPWLTDRQDALRVAAFLGIPMHTINFEKEYKKTVLDYFFKEYSAGRTPNPDVMCNKEIKFKMLYKWALAHGFDYIATGHYARVAQSKKVNENFHLRQGRGITSKRAKPIKSSSTQSFELLRSKDDFKDQTYFIYNILQSQLPHLLFPIGAMKKSEVKRLAKKIGLPNADKKESMGLCFVGKIRLKEFLEQKLKPKPGPVIDLSGKEIGEHQGLAFYTIGQRQGIGIGRGGPWYVVRKDLKKNTLVVTNDPKDKALETKEVEIHSVNFITTPLFSDAKNKSKEVSLQGRYRHQGKLEKLTLQPLSRGHYRVEFAKPQPAVASGQSLVLYDGQVCIGGGVIV